MPGESTPEERGVKFIATRDGWTFEVVFGDEDYDGLARLMGTGSPQGGAGVELGAGAVHAPAPPATKKLGRPKAAVKKRGPIAAAKPGRVVVEEEPPSTIEAAESEPDESAGAEDAVDEPEPDGTFCDICGELVDEGDEWLGEIRRLIRRDICFDHAMTCQCAISGHEDHQDGPDGTCGKQIETDSQARISALRFRVPLCKSCLRDYKPSATTDARTEETDGPEDDPEND